MSRTAIVLVVLVLLVAAASAWLLRSPDSYVTASLTAADLVLTGHHADGSEAWILNAASAEITDDRQQLQSVRLTFLRSDGVPIVARADQLVRTPSGSTLSGAVAVEDGDTRLTTEEMFWDEQNDVLEAGGVQFTLGNASLTGNAFRHDLDTDVTTVSGGVSARLSQDGTSYSAYGETAEAASDRLHLLHEVTVNTDSGDAYACDRLTILPDEDAIELSENVSGTWQSSTFTADTVRLDASGVRLRGHVTINLEMLGMDSQS